MDKVNYLNSEQRESGFNIGAITGGVDVPSRRFRIEALVPHLERRGVKVTELCPAISAYPPARSLFIRPPWFFVALAERLTYIARARGFDAIVLQRELISTLPTIERLIPGPRILDVDDAIFLHRRGLAAKSVATSALGVVCGNGFLAEHFSQWNDNVTVIPTGVDTEKLRPRPSYGREWPKIVGWIGTSGNMCYLEPVAAAIRRSIKGVSGAEFHVISDSIETLPEELKPIAHFTRWYPGIEREHLPKWSVGLMPLTPGDWERGKCAFKLLQYLAAGVPAVASPVGMNVEVMGKKEVGFLADDGKAWEEAIVDLLTDEAGAQKLARNARQLVEADYCLTVISAKWRKVLDQWLD